MQLLSREKPQHASSRRAHTFQQGQAAYRRCILSVDKEHRKKRSQTWLLHAKPTVAGCRYQVTQMLDKHNTTSERVALSSLVTAACYVIKCVKMSYCCPTPGLPLNSKYGLVRRELQQKPVTSRSCVWCGLGTVGLRSG